MEKVLSNILLRIISLGLSYWFYRGHLEQYVHYIAHYGPYFQVFLNLVIIILLGYFVYAFLKLLLSMKIKQQTLLLLYFIYFLSLFYLHFDSFFHNNCSGIPITVHSSFLLLLPIYLIFLLFFFFHLGEYG